MDNQEEFSAPDIEKGRLLFAQECKFVWGVQNLDQFPDLGLNEIAFAGRSNVGKSSLINSLVNHQALARTSHTPGRTQQLNYFDLGGKLCLVDMPGYGYAKASKVAIANWNMLIKAYLRGRPNLMRVYVLVDSRHGLKDSDKEIMGLLDECAVSYRLILTKVDKASESALQKLITGLEETLKKHPAAFPTPLSTSSAKKTGLELVRAEIAQFSQ